MPARPLLRCLGVATLAASISSVAIADVYRCTEAGKTVYSDKPCQGGAAATVPVPPRITDPTQVNPQYEANMGRITVGQTPLQVEMAWGRPKAKNIDTGSSGRTEQWIYERPDGTAYVYFRGGVMSSYSQRVAESTASSVEPPPETQPTLAQIDARIRAEKAGERRFIRERTHQSQVVKRIGEPDSKVPVGAAECWYYSATRLDPQTNTKICYDVSGFVLDVERLVPR